MRVCVRAGPVSELVALKGRVYLGFWSPNADKGAKSVFIKI